MTSVHSRNATMKIAFISYEFPPDTAVGGIATYVNQAARMLSERGHQVEVFSGSPYRTESGPEDGIYVNRIRVSDEMSFSQAVAPVFAQRHSVVVFDVLEGPEARADARHAVHLVPDIPFVLKLHTPAFVAQRLNNPQLPPSFLRRLRGYMGAVRRRSKPFWFYEPRHDVEYWHAIMADEIASPSRAIGEMLIKAWHLKRSKISNVPLPYTPCEELLNIPVRTQNEVVTFLGRLEKRKGVLDLAEAIPMILGKHPSAKFRFVGRPLASPEPGLDMRQYLQQALRPCLASIEFVDAVLPQRIPAVLAATDICVFPSIWESFGLVCVEAMSAGRGVVASSAGGMAELLNFGQVGLTVPPQDSGGIARAVVHLLQHPDYRMALGEAARARVLSEYSAEKVATLQEASYQRAIERRLLSGPRPPAAMRKAGVS